MVAGGTNHIVPLTESSQGREEYERQYAQVRIGLVRGRESPLESNVGSLTFRSLQFLGEFHRQSMPYLPVINCS